MFNLGAYDHRTQSKPAQASPFALWHVACFVCVLEAAFSTGWAKKRLNISSRRTKIYSV